jgi:hypothetical protein
LVACYRVTFTFTFNFTLPGTPHSHNTRHIHTN